MFNTREENAEDLRLETEPNIQGVCKDCGNGTLNNMLNLAFVLGEDDAIECNRCGSTHVDCLVF